jgi:long-subunit fatty acid transport protein
MKVRIAVSLLAILVVGMRLHGQEDASFAGFQFNRSLPGARSLAMGGAFVAVADDATAAYSNPAGLTLLESPEASLEVRSWNTSTVYTASGDGTPGSSFRLSDFNFDRAKSYTVAPSFVSAVYSRPRARWAAAVYRHELIDFHNRFSSFGVRKNDSDFFGPLDFSTDVEIVNFGAAGSFRINDSLRVGLGVSYFDFHLRSRQLIQKDNFSLLAGKEGDDSGIDFNAGVLWQIDPAWTVGAAYRRGPTFEMNECFPYSTHSCFRGREHVSGPGGFDVISKFHVPDQAALGVAYQPIEPLTVLFEVDRVEYSALLDGNRLGHFIAEGRSLGFHLDDANEIRLGVEYLVPLEEGSVAVLLGGWYDPDHTITFQAEGAADNLRMRRAYFQPTGKDEIHVSGGLQIRLWRSQVNFAFDHSARIDTLALSTVVRLH